jgi:hypothetical protein
LALASGGRSVLPASSNLSKTAQHAIDKDRMTELLKTGAS